MIRRLSYDQRTSLQLLVVRAKSLSLLQRDPHMQLIGLFDSPFVRRVAISLRLTGQTFHHLNWSVGRDFARIRDFNPLGRVPTLVLEGGEVLFESAAILDYIDEQAGARALLPHSGAARRRGLRLLAIATGAAEKGVTQVYERVMRPAEKLHQPWLDRCATQVDGALRLLDHECEALKSGGWLLGEQMMQPDITAACVSTFVRDALSLDMAAYPALEALRQRCEALPVFKQHYLAFYVPKI